MDLTRREFIKTVSFLGGAVIIGGCELFNPREEIPPYIYGGGFADPAETVTGIDTIYSVCAMCEGNCGIRARIKDGWLVKIDGNPYHPNSREPHVPLQIDSKEAIKVAGSTCVKGQSGIQTLYNPYRVKEPLKRVGPRGSGIWKAISWDQAVGEIVNGGDLFGEGAFEGLRQIRDVHRPLDESRPEFGPGANRLILLSGRIDLGAKTFLNRFMNAYGSVNRIYGDETLWDSSRRAGFQLTFDQGYDDLQADVLNCRYLLSFGSSPLESGNPMQSVARKLMKARFGPLGGIESMQDEGYGKAYKGRYGQLKWVVVDPRMSESASKAHQWIPIEPGAYAALALGMIRRIIEKVQYNTAFLENTSAKAAQRDGEGVWTDATYLVRLDTMTFIKAGEAGLAGKSSKFLVFDGERVVPFDSVDHGVPEADVRLNGIRCKSVFSLLKGRAYEKTVEQYGQICGIGPHEIEKIADEFAENGRRAVAELGEAAASHANGTYTARTINILNLLVGNINRKGGLIAGGNWEPIKKKRFLFNMEHVENGSHLAGLRIDRAGVAYEDSREYRAKGFPAQRPWFPFLKAFGNVQEIIPSLYQGYPYPIGALIIYHFDPVYEVPAIRELAEGTLRDRKKVPLLVVIDTEITESAKFADYILPETTYLERWDICEVAAGIPTKALGVRQPVVGYSEHKTGRYIPIFPKTKVMEDIFIQIAKKLNLPGFGKDGFEKGRPLENAWEYYRRFITMLTSGRYGFGVPGLNDDYRLQFVLSRGGIFEPYEKAYQGEYARYRYRGLCKIYNEELGKSKDSLTGKTYDGLPRYEPIDRLKYNKDFPLKLISYRLSYHSMMRTAQNRWILELLPQNYVMINPRDAKRYGIRTGDIVKVQSRNSAVIGRAMVRQGILPGVVGVPYGFGNRECGAGSVKIDGKATSFDHTRGKGITILPVATRDPVTKLGPLQDPIGGNVAINDTWVRLLEI